MSIIDNVFVNTISNISELCIVLCNHNTEIGGKLVVQHSRIAKVHL